MWVPAVWGACSFVWGRGAIDLKGNVVALLHAVNQLAASGFKPRRSFYVALGHDEEVRCLLESVIFTC